MKRSIKVSLRSVLLHLFFIGFSLIFIIPMVAMISVSISDEIFVKRNGYSILPRAINFDAYRLIFENPKIILDAYKVSMIVTVTGTFFALLISAMCAYAISRADFKLKKHITFYLFFTMLFNGGLVPTYILLTRYMHMKDTLAGLIFPTMVNVFFIFILRTFIQSLPFSIIESATMDGASEFRIFFQIIIPLSKPALATVGLMILLNYWNEWFMALLLIRKSYLRPLQFLLQQMLMEVESMIRDINEGSGIVLMDPAKVPTETTRMAMAVIAAGPVLFVFPFFQKYFTKGMTVGSIKG